jgi:phosphoribosylcarboxyaminoimidazole (NCAIR) mutase
MSHEEKSDAHRAEEIRIAVMREVQELGIQVVVLGASRRIVLNGCVATAERRAQVAGVAARMQPDFRIEDRIVVAAMATPRVEQLP